MNSEKLELFLSGKRSAVDLDGMQYDIIGKSEYGANVYGVTVQSKHTKTTEVLFLIGDKRSIFTIRNNDLFAPILEILPQPKPVVYIVYEIDSSSIPFKMYQEEQLAKNHVEDYNNFRGSEALKYKPVTLD